MQSSRAMVSLLGIAVLSLSIGITLKYVNAAATSPERAAPVVFPLEDELLMLVHADYVDGTSFDFVADGLPNATEWSSDWYLNSKSGTVVFQDFDIGIRRDVTVCTYSIDGSTLRIYGPNGENYFTGSWTPGPGSREFTISRISPTAGFSDEPGDPAGIVYKDEYGNVVQTDPLPPIHAPEVTSIVLRIVD